MIIDSEKLYHLCNKENGKLLEGGGGDVAILTWTGTERQYWKIIHVARGYYHLQSKENGKYLEGGGGVGIWSWTGTERQYWKLVDADQNYYSLQSKENNRWLEGGDDVAIWQRTDAERQYWRILAANPTREDADPYISLESGTNPENIGDVPRMTSFGQTLAETTVAATLT